MKKSMILLLAFVVVTDCQKAEISDSYIEGGTKTSLEVIATIESSAKPSAKTTMTNIDGILKSKWAAGDNIYVHTYWSSSISNIGSPVKCTAEMSGETVKFVTDPQGGITVPEQYPASECGIYAEYPSALSGMYLNQRGFSMPSRQTQSAPGDLSHIAKDNILYALPVVPDWNANPIAVNFTFKHALSVLQINLKGTEQGIKISSLTVEMLDDTGTDFLVITDGLLNLHHTQDNVPCSITAKTGENLMTLNLASPVELPVQDYAQFYMTISPGHAGQTFKVSGLSDTGVTFEIGRMKVPSSSSIPQGAKAVKAFSVHPPESDDYADAIDLSAMATANTYIVNKPNTLYKFNAQVMGNGVVPSAMTSTVPTTVISPMSALSLWYTCKQTSIAWEDRSPVVIPSIELKDGYIYFKTPETFVNGNMVIAAFAEPELTYSNIEVNEDREFANATVLWSWNIWAVEDYDPETSKIPVGDQFLMDRNLGALVAMTDADAEANRTNGVWVANGQGNYYEWGRKDPFPGFAEYPAYQPLDYGQKLRTAPAYTLIKTLQMNGIGAGGKLNNQMFGSNQAVSIPTSSTHSKTDVELLAYVNGNPHKDIEGGSTSYNWHSKGMDKYWKELWGQKDRTVTPYKTAYDPCPPGWKLWEYETMEKFIMDNESTVALLDSNPMKCFGITVANSLFPMNGGGRKYSLDLWSYGALIHASPKIAAPIATYTSSPYYYHEPYHDFYSGDYSVAASWNVVVVEQNKSMSLEMIKTDSKNSRKYSSIQTAYTSRAIPVRCIKQ